MLYHLIYVNLLIKIQFIFNWWIWIRKLRLWFSIRPQLQAHIYLDFQLYGWKSHHWPITMNCVLKESKISLEVSRAVWVSCAALFIHTSVFRLSMCALICTWALLTCVFLLRSYGKLCCLLHFWLAIRIFQRGVSGKNMHKWEMDRGDSAVIKLVIRNVSWNHAVVVANWKWSDGDFTVFLP